MINIPVEVNRWLTRKTLQYPNVVITGIERYENIYEVNYNTRQYNNDGELIIGTAFLRVDKDNQMSDTNIGE